MAVQIKKNQSNLLCGRTRLGMTQVVKTCRGACATDVLPTHPCNSKGARRAIKNHRVLYLHSQINTNNHHSCCLLYDIRRGTF